MSTMHIIKPAFKDPSKKFYPFNCKWNGNQMKNTYFIFLIFEFSILIIKSDIRCIYVERSIDFIQKKKKKNSWIKGIK